MADDEVPEGTSLPVAEEANTAEPATATSTVIPADPLKAMTEQGIAAIAASAVGLSVAYGVIPASATVPSEATATASSMLSVLDSARPFDTRMEATSRGDQRDESAQAGEATTRARMDVLSIQAQDIASARNTSPDNRGVFALPAAGRLSSDFGWRSMGYHYGIDIAAPCGSAIWAGEAGTVIWAGRKPISGLAIDILHPDGKITRYYHASAIHVVVGQQVVRGEQIGEVGSSGRSTGCHLHFQVEVGGAPVDPEPFLYFG